MKNPDDSIPETARERKLTPREANRLLDSLYEKFGKVVFLVLDYARKEFKNCEWEKITYQDTLRPPYRTTLVCALVRSGNIAVRLGPLSDGLRAVDIDIKERVGEFEDRNPALENTMVVRGRKGAQFFLRVKGVLPHKNKAVDKLKTIDGQAFGEWRHGENGGAYSMIYGRHPDEQNVQFSLAGHGPVVEVDFATLRWPKDILLPWAEADQGADQLGGKGKVAIDASLERRVKAYLDSCPPSIAGEHGDDRLFAAACKILNGFALTPVQAAFLLWRHFNPRC